MFHPAGLFVSTRDKAGRFLRNRPEKNTNDEKK